MFPVSLLAQTTPTADRGILMSIIIWLFIGLIAGFIASKVVNKKGEGVVLDIILGLVGAFVAGLVMHLLNVGGGGLGFTIFAATLGAIAVLFVYHMIVGKRTSA